jgi:hypothetical protein
MAVPPRRATAYDFETAVVSQADTDIFQTTVTLAAGDVQVSLDGGAFANITGLPVEIAATGVLTVSLTVAEMTADRVAVLFNDAAGNEWQDLLVTIETSTVQLSDLPTSASAASASASAGEILILRGDSMSQAILALGDISTRTEMWFTVKAKTSDTDAEAILLISEGTGLEVLNGVDVSATRAAEATITVNDPALGNITVWVDPTATDELVPSSTRHYDVQWTDATDVSTPAIGRCRVRGDVTRTVT